MQLTKYEAARNALQVASTVDEVKDIRDKSEAMAAYARQAKDKELLKWATEIKVRAERRAGQMLAEMPKATGAKMKGGTTGGPIVVPPANDAQTLAEIGVTKNESSRWQKLAAVSDEQFESAVASAKDKAGEVTTAAMMRAAKAAEPEKPAAEQKPRKPDPEPSPTDPPPPEYTPLDEAMDTVRELQDALALANAGDLSDEDKTQAADLIARLREENRILTLKLKAMTAARDGFMTQVAELKKQCAMQRKELDKR